MDLVVKFRLFRHVPITGRLLFGRTFPGLYQHNSLGFFTVYNILLGGKATHAKSYQPPTVTKAPEPEELEDEWEGDERMKGIDKKLAKMIKDEIMDSSPNMSWNDIAGLESAKCAIKEIIVWPMLRPDIFKGIRGPPKGVLLFGPPG